MYVLFGPGENALVRWGRVRLVLGLLLVISGFAMASRFTNPGYPYGLRGVVRQGGLLLIPILIGAALIWWGRRLSILYLLSLTLVLTGLAVALWGPEWGCVPDQPGELCYLVAYSLPGIWLTVVMGSGAALALVSFITERRSRPRSN